MPRLRLYLPILAVVSLAPALHGGDAPIGQMKADLFHLAGEECEGRGLKTAGINKAAAYIAAEFKRLGLKPGGSDGYYQPFRVHYRLVGTEIVRWARADFTGRYADELIFDEEGRDWTDYYRMVVEARQPLYSFSDWVEEYRAPRWVESIICPLSDDGETVDRCIAVEDYEPMSDVEIEGLPAVGRR